MKLNDAERGVKNHIPDELHEELHAFIKVRRNQLAHRFLIEHIEASEEGEPRFRARSMLDLLETHIQANALAQKLHERTMEILSTWPESEQPSEEIRLFMQKMLNVAMRKDFPQEVQKDVDLIEAERKLST